MKRIASLCLIPALSLGALFFLLPCPVAAQQGAINLAPIAQASVGGGGGQRGGGPNAGLAAINNGIDPTSSQDRQHGAFGGGRGGAPGRRGGAPATGTQTMSVQYEWTQPISTAKIEVYWLAGAMPKEYRLQYWNGSEYVSVTNASGFGTESDKYNTTSFTEATTARLRLEYDYDAAAGTPGLLQWKVYDSGKTPNFPPIVTAGLDRAVVIGGKTYLSGSVKDEGKPKPVVATWSKLSGPGEVSFADAHAPVTTATFSKAGDYILKLTGDDGDLQTSQTLVVKAAEPPPTDRLDVVYTKNYSIDSPLWNARAKALITHWIPHCIDQINSTNLTQGPGGIDNFIEAAKALRGEPHGAHKGFVFANAWVHQTVESMCIALMIDPKGDPEIIKAQDKMKATLEDWIPKILAAQEPDGYLQTAYTLANRSRWPEHWDPSHRGDHEGYVSGYFIESAINHYTMTNGKDKRLYDAAKKLADCWADHIGPGKKEWYDGHQEMEQALVRFGRFVNDMEGPGHGDRYIALARFLLDSRRGGSEYDQSHLPIVQQYEAVGHAVRASYTYSAVADVAAETHNPDYQSAALSLWDSLVNRKYFVTGGIGSLSSNEGFGPDYVLPNNSYCEACSTCGLIFFQWKMNLAYHDAKYADLYEESLYNALLGSIDLNGETFYYDNPLVGGRRAPWHGCPCCVGNIPRTLLMIPTWTYVKGTDGLYVNLYIGGTINVERVAGTDVQMVQKTDYPWSGDVSITVNPKASKEFTVYVRVPNRTTSDLYMPTPRVSGLKSLAVNGAKIDAKIQNGYVAITRSWNAGDKIELSLPMEPQRIKAIDKVAADRGRVALRYGPLLYNVERADEQDVNQLLMATAPLTAEWRPDLLQGVMVLKGKWADGSPMLAVPNYARNNRPGASAGSMVWISDQPAAGAP